MQPSFIRESVNLSLLYPNKCLLCHTPLAVSAGNNIRLCNSCSQEVRTKYRFSGSISLESADGGTAALLYSGSIANAMKQFKFHHKKFYAAWFAAYTAAAISNHIKEWTPDYITYIPIGPIRKHQRGYNQSELIAKEIAAQFHIPCISMLKKRLFVQKQSKLQSAEARKANTENAFLPSCKIDLTGKSILLIDDVITTGASMSAAATVLKRMGARKVYACAPLKTPLSKEKALR